MEENYEYIFKEMGFVLIGYLSYRLQLHIWWHPEQYITAIDLRIGSRSLLKANKSYYLQSISKEGQLWARDIGPLQDYLENHFQEIHISFSNFRDVPSTLASMHMKRKLESETLTKEMPTVVNLAKLQKLLHERKLEKQATDKCKMLGFDNNSDLLSSYMKGQQSGFEKEIRNLESRIEYKKEKLSMYENLQKEYQQKGSAACFVFNVSSNTQFIDNPVILRDALNSVCKELLDLHRYQITQKLCGGRLNIYISEAKEPIVVWIEEWLGGALPPRQMEHFKNYFKLLYQASIEHMMVTPKEDIVLKENVKDTQKLIAGRVLSTMLKRMDNTESLNRRLKHVPEDAMPVNLGLFMDDTKITDSPAIFPLTEFLHAYTSGTTGSGKSYAVRVITEEATIYKNLNILILDPRNQAIGLLVPEDREKILSLYPEFGHNASKSRSYNFNYHAPGKNFGSPLTEHLSSLCYGKNIVSFKWQDDKNRCEKFKKIMDAVFQEHSKQESEQLRLLIIIEEAQCFTKKRVDDSAKTAAEKAEIAIDRMVREGRKYGICVIIVSQAIKDFSRDTASTRQNTNTKFFLHNSDREIDYAADFIGDGRQIIQLQPRTAIVYNPSWGVAKIKVRPPFSKVWDFGDEGTRKIVSGNLVSVPKLTEESQTLLDYITTHFENSNTGMNLSSISKELGITSKRKLQQLVGELESSGLVKTYKINARGNPRLIEPVLSEEKE